MITCFESILGGGLDIRLSQSASGRVFKVTYGLQQDQTRSYKEAALLLGAALMHRAACNGLLNNDAPND